MKTIFYSAAFIIMLITVCNKSKAQANQALSNLSAPTAINQSLLPGSDNSKDLGSSAKQWRNLYLANRFYFKGILTMQSPGTDNFFIGPNAGNISLTGTGNTGIGQGALYKVTSGVSNTATGMHALYSNTNGSENTADGLGALYSNNNAIDNTATGFQSMNLNTTGNLNVADGAHALFHNTTGEQNTVIGYAAFYINTTGSFNTALGCAAAVNYTNLTNSMALGYNATVRASNEVVVGNGAVKVIGGQVGWSTISDGRFKTNVRQNVPGLIFIKLLKPVTYNIDVRNYERFLGKDESSINKLKGSYDDAERKLHTGFVAQDVESAAQLINYDFDGINHPQNEKDNYSLVYANFIPSLVKALQELSKMNDKKDAKIDSLENESILQKKISSDLEERLAKLEAMMKVQSSGINNQQSANLSSGLLEQNTPNPFSNTTIINYSLPQHYSSAKITITDKTGKALKEMNVSGNGKQSLQLNASLFNSGAYQYSLIIDGKLIDTKQLVLAK